MRRQAFDACRMWLFQAQNNVRQIVADCPYNHLRLEKEGENRCRKAASRMIRDCYHFLAIGSTTLDVPVDSSYFFSFFEGAGKSLIFHIVITFYL